MPPMRHLYRAALSAAVVALSLGIALTAANVVPASRIWGGVDAIDANDLKPPECSALVLGTIVTPSGSVGPPGGAALVLGTAGPDSLRGLGGDDCIVGGGGDDFLRGDGGFDVCIGGPGVDTFHRSCEMQIQ